MNGGWLGKFVMLVAVMAVATYVVIQNTSAQHGSLSLSMQENIKALRQVEKAQTLANYLISLPESERPRLPPPLAFYEAIEQHQAEEAYRKWRQAEERRQRSAQ